MLYLSFVDEVINIKTIKNKVMATKKNEPLEIVRNIVNQIDLEIKSTEGTINYLKKAETSETNQALMLEIKGHLETLIRLREFTIYKS